MSTTKISVVMVEDDVRLRDQLVSILKSAPDIRYLYSVSTAKEALERIPQEPPDLVLMDINLPGMSGIECLAILKDLVPNTAILMLTVNDDENTVFEALKAGANGYLLKSSRPQVLYEAIRDVHAGGASFSSDIARKVVLHFQSQGKAARDALAPRELETLKLMASGFIDKEIADKMQVSLVTIRTYVKRICAKLRVRSRIAAVIKYRS